MSDAFDPYDEWFRIPPHEQPPDLYRLLGLSRFEHRLKTIEDGYHDRMERLHQKQTGPRAAHAERLKQEVTKALGVLRDDATRAAYDRGLLAASGPPPDEPDELYNLAPLDNLAPSGLQNQPVRVRPKATPSRRKPTSPVVELIKIVLGGVAGLGLGLVIVVFAWKTDPFGLFPARKVAKTGAASAEPLPANGSNSIASGTDAPHVPGPPPQRSRPQPSVPAPIVPPLPIATDTAKPPGPEALNARVVEPAVAPTRSPLALFDEDRDFPALFDTGDGKVAIEEHDAYTGKISARVTPSQRYFKDWNGRKFKIRWEPKADDEYRYVRFCWKKSRGTEIGIQFRATDYKGPHEWIRYHVGPRAEFLRGHSIYLGNQEASEWMEITRDLARDVGDFTLTGLALNPSDGEYGLYDCIYLARELKDFDTLPPPRRGTATRRLPATFVSKLPVPAPSTSGAEAAKPGARASPPTARLSRQPLALFDEERDFPQLLNEGTGKAELDETDVYSGKVSVRVTPRYRCRKAWPGPPLKIRKQPLKDDEFRYLRFCWKKAKGTEIGIEFQTLGRAGPDDWIRYHIGPNHLLSNRHSIHLGDYFAADWMEVTRDLAADEGEFTIIGLALRPSDGDYGLYDGIYLARDLKDFENLPNARSGAK